MLLLLLFVAYSNRPNFLPSLTCPTPSPKISAQ
jgi:hypothetical protein